MERLLANPRNRVDQRAVLRARLLHMILADWDRRHDDQWRWLAYPRPGGGLLFRAVPRDRDQVFFCQPRHFAPCGQRRIPATPPARLRL